jgi:hydroxymethylbilane synthase
MRKIIIGTRGSDLAKWQAAAVADALRAMNPSLNVELKIIHTRGDALQESSPLGPQDKGMFTTEIERQLQEGAIHLAAHSLKDLPTTLPEDLCLAAVLPREDSADALICKNGERLMDLPPGATVLTGSLRRRALLLAARPDLVIQPIRGNVPTRLEKLDASDAVATVLAVAGLVRLGLGHRICERLDPEVFTPACGQGAIVAETRKADEESHALLQRINHIPTQLTVGAERAFLAEMGAGCHAPVGAYACFTEEGKLTLHAMLALADGSKVLREAQYALVKTSEEAEELGRKVARFLISHGGEALLGQNEPSEFRVDE